MSKSKKKIVWTKLFIFVFVLYALFIIANQQITIFKLNKSMNEISRNVELSKIENEKFKDMLKNVSDNEYIERMAREHLGLIKPDEIVYVDQSSSDVYLQEGGN